MCAIALRRRQPLLAGEPELLQKWQTVEPIFWRAWLRKLRNRVIRPKSNVYQLVDDEGRPTKQ